MNLRVIRIHVAEDSRREHNGFLVKRLGRGNGGAICGEQHSLSKSRVHQVGWQGAAIPTLERGAAKIDVVDLDSLFDDVLRQACRKDSLVCSS